MRRGRVVTHAARSPVRPTTNVPSSPMPGPAIHLHLPLSPQVGVMGDEPHSEPPEMGVGAASGGAWESLPRDNAPHDPSTISSKTTI